MNLQELKKLKDATYKYFDEKSALEAVKKDGINLKYVANQTEEICLAAVKQNCYALVYVANQTEEICLEAVKQDGYALKYVKPNIFNNLEVELSVKEISELLGYKIKVVE